MTDYKQRAALVVDNGLFCELAVTLAQDFGRVLYWTPWVSAYPKSNALMMGQGLEGVTRVRDIWADLDEVDICVFPDVYFGDLQLHLESLGKRVWGCRKAELFELDRIGSKELCKKLGIDIGHYDVVTGFDALREYLREHDDIWVKISATRGDMESFHAESYSVIEPRLNELEFTLGAKAKVMNFILEAGIDPAVEVGFDGYTIDGQFPQQALCGVEIKNKGYVSRVMPYGSLPEGVRSVNDKLSGAFGVSRYRGFWSSEIRITPDGTAYLIDPTARMGSPPGELYLEMIANWSDIIWEGSEGNLVEPEYRAKYGAQLMLISQWADKNWLTIDFPPELRRWVKLHSAVHIADRWYAAPQWTGMAEIGAVVAFGDSYKEAIELCRQRAEQVKGYSMVVEEECLDEALNSLNQLSKQTRP